MSKHRSSDQDRSDLTGEHPLGDGGQLIFFLVFTVVWLGDSFWLRWTTFLNDALPGALQLLVGIPLVLLAVYLARAGMATIFGKVRETPQVIREGVLGVVRHPIYLSEMVLYVGMLCLSLSLAAAVVAVAASVFLVYLCRYEERLLLARFGQDYRDYMREVGMLLPRLPGR